MLRTFLLKHKIINQKFYYARFKQIFISYSSAKHEKEKNMNGRFLGIAKIFMIFVYI